ncbi:hypothetical protein C8Q78DRAFT_347040 [Trametes maxima]|nr:hypothetical protein C8Q78DRAFT_347040 [Trametes maxima]
MNPLPSSSYYSNMRMAAVYRRPGFLFLLHPPRSSVSALLCLPTPVFMHCPLHHCATAPSPRTAVSPSRLSPSPCDPCTCTPRPGVTSPRVSSRRRIASPACCFSWTVCSPNPIPPSLHARVPSAPFPSRPRLHPVWFGDAPCRVSINPPSPLLSPPPRLALSPFPPLRLPPFSPRHPPISRASLVWFWLQFLVGRRSRSVSSSSNNIPFPSPPAHSRLTTGSIVQRAVDYVCAYFRSSSSSTSSSVVHDRRLSDSPSLSLPHPAVES